MNREGVRQIAQAAISGGFEAKVLRRADVNKTSYDLRIKPGPGGKYPDTFYREVAGFYMAMLEAGYIRHRT